MSQWNELMRASLGGEVHRRSFMKMAAVATLPLFGRGRLSFAEETKLAGLIVREKEPENLEFPFAKLDGFLTPNELFYIRNHFTKPKIEAATWRLKVVGAVEKPLELTYDQVLALPSRTMPITLECAGNGRSQLNPKAKGVQWELGAVSTADWTGVPLATILEKAGVKKDAVDVVLEGTDEGEPKNDPKPVGTIHFARGMPLAKALKPEVLLAYKMNGDILPSSHGFPLRAVVGGWYGMASVKWLQRIVVTDKPFNGYDQTADYAIWVRRDNLPTLVPITDIDVKSSIARPVAGETVAAGKDYRVFGAAWAGEAEIAKVEVSTDGGKTWQEAKLLGKSLPLAWRLWEHTWRAPSEGKYVMMSRATDTRGRIQPRERDADRRSYMINHVAPIEVEVK
jgi:DMSO/TMAO reductase YedYZ molybdopterin-dependent catalytic subunit